MGENNFQEKLIRGKIAETVFEQMFREGTDFDIYPLGYEHTIPILCQFRDQTEHQNHKDIINKILNNFDNTPDFLLVKPDKSNLYVVEVKYRTKYDANEIQEIAQEIRSRWDPVYLFLATPERFYFGSCKDTIENSGQMKHFNWISPDIQQKYLKIIQEFEK